MTNPQTLERKLLLERELTRYLQVLTEQDDTEKILVFGSLVTGQIHAWSDIDLVVIKKSNLPFFQRLREIRHLIKPQVGVDILVYTPEEFKQLFEERPFFREEIWRKSRVLYERKC